MPAAGCSSRHAVSRRSDSGSMRLRVEKEDHRSGAGLPPVVAARRESPVRIECKPCSVQIGNGPQCSIGRGVVDDYDVRVPRQGKRLDAIAKRAGAVERNDYDVDGQEDSARAG